MSAEVSRSSGTGEPIPPQRPEGRFSWFIRLFTKPPGHQATYPRIVQYPLGLEDFATKLEKGVSDRLVAQKETERKTAEANSARIHEEAEEKVRTLQRQRQLENQERTRQMESVSLGSEILRNFRVSGRLRHIQQTVWERKGQIRSLEPRFSSGEKEPDMLGGLELIHHFPFVTREEAGDPPNRSGRFYRWRNIPVTGSMQLSIRVLKINKGPDIDKSMLVVSEDTISPLWMPIRGIFIPIDAEESEGLLEEALIKDSLDRVSHHGLPSQRERQAINMLVEARRSEGWMKWVIVAEPEVAD